MSTIKILHAADLHLDSPFQALSAAKASIRRGEQRELLARLAELALIERVDLVLLSGDLLDSATPYTETAQELVRHLGSISAPVFIAPGNHDFYSPHSPYARVNFPGNVHIFTRNQIESVSLPALGVNVYGAAFTDSESIGLLCGFHAEREEGFKNLLCMHAELCLGDSKYNPITEKEIADSGMDYVALGHVHKASGLKKAGEVYYSWPGCPEGRGFDECGQKYVNIVELGEGECKLRQVSIASRKYEILKLDVSGSDPVSAIHDALPDDSVSDIYRIILCGETETAPDLRRLQASFSELFFQLQIRDETRIRRSLWEKSGEDTLKGLFLSKLKAMYDSSSDDKQRIKIEQAARWGLAALDNMEEVVCHGDK